MQFCKLAVSGFLLMIFVSRMAVADSNQQEVNVVFSEALENGRLTVLRKQSVDPACSRLLIHFHGAVDTVTREYQSSRFDGIVAVVNFPGLSSVYATPFEKNPLLFDLIVQKALNHPASGDSAEVILPANQDLTCIVSSFSAGFGAVRKILDSPENLNRIDSIVMADSIYAGLESNQELRTVSSDNMQGFLKFAQLAAMGQKTMLISHSAQKTSYASTTETADYLLKELCVPRNAATVTVSVDWATVSKAQQKRFVVLGFGGETGPHHMEHLRKISGLWNLALDLQSAEVEAQEDVNQ